MKLVLFEAPGGAVSPGLLTPGGVVDIADAVPLGHTPQLTMQGIIDGFEGLRPALERLQRPSASRCRCPGSDCARRCRARERSWPASRITGSMARSTRGR